MKRDDPDLRLARRLASAAARIVLDEGGAAWLVSGPRATRSRVGDDSLRRLRARGALAGDDHAGFTLSPEGRAMVRRSLADPDDLAAQHQLREKRVIEIDGARHAVTVDAAESPLAWLRARRGRDGAPMIDAAAYEAGERFRSDFTRGQLMPGISANWSAVGGGGGQSGISDLTETALAARFRVEKALAAVGPELSGILVDFCCFLKGIEEIERQRDWPKRSAKLVLQLGLAALARHYGLSEAAVGAQRNGGLRASG